MPTKDQLASIATSLPTKNDLAAMASSTPAPDPFSAAPDNKEGTYQMQSSDGTLIKVPYSKVMSASKSGYKISPDDRLRFGKDKLYELSGKGMKDKFNPDNDLPESFTAISASDKTPWYKPNIKGAERAVLDLLPTAGGIAVGIIGGGAGIETGPGAIATGAAGAAAGGVVGEDLRQYLTEKVFPFEHHMTPKEAAEQMALQGGIQGASEAGGRLAGIPLSKVARYLGKTAMESAKAGIRLLPSEAGGRAPTWMENFLKGSVLSKGMMERFREAQNKESAAAVEKLMDSISSFKGTPEQLGKAVQKGLDDSEAALRAEQNLAYDALDNITEQVVTPPKPKLTIVLKKDGKPLLDAAGKPVMKKIMQPEVTRVMPSMVGLKDFAREQLEKINKPPYFLPKDVAEKSRDAFNTILQNPDNVSFKRMRDMRSVLLSQVRDLDQAMGGSKLGLAKKVETLTDQSIEDAAKNSGIPGLYNRWRQANEVTAEGHRMFEQKLVEKAAETNDPEFIASLLGGNKIGIQQTRDLFKALPEKLHDPVRRGLLEDAVTKATEPRSGAFDEGKFATYVDRIGDERGSVIFGPNWKNVKELVDIIGKINGPVGLGGGGGAALQNVGIMKKLGSIALGGGPEILALATGAGTGHLLEAAQGIAAEAATARIVAWGMTNPAKAVKMLGYLRQVVKYLPYAGTAAGYEAIDLGRKHEGKPPSVLEKMKEKGEALKDKYTKSSAPIPAPVVTHTYDPATEKIVPVQ